MDATEKKLDKILYILEKQERRAKWAIFWKIFWTVIIIIVFVLPIYITYKFVQGLDVDALLNGIGTSELEKIMNMLPLE